MISFHASSPSSIAGSPGLQTDKQCGGGAGAEAGGDSSQGRAG